VRFDKMQTYLQSIWKILSPIRPFRPTASKEGLPYENTPAQDATDHQVSVLRDTVYSFVAQKALYRVEKRQAKLFLLWESLTNKPVCSDQPEFSQFSENVVQTFIIAGYHAEKVGRLGLDTTDGQEAWLSYRLAIRGLYMLSRDNFSLTQWQNCTSVLQSFVSIKFIVPE
jgi:hypothetical protein